MKRQPSPPSVSGLTVDFVDHALNPVDILFALTSDGLVFQWDPETGLATRFADLKDGDAPLAPDGFARGTFRSIQITQDNVALCLTHLGYVYRLNLGTKQVSRFGPLTEVFKGRRQQIRRSRRLS